jgi:hypothetical protein
MSLNNFIPQLWADSLLKALRKNLVYGGPIINRDYEGQIQRMGDTVRINMIGDITISNYTKDTDLASPQALTDAQSQLTITQAKYFNFEIDDVDQAQNANGGAIMQEAMSWAAYRLRDTIDQYLAGFYVDAATANALNGGAAVTTLVAPTQANVGTGITVYDKIVLLGQLLTQQAVPINGRWCVIPPWCKTQLTMDVRFSGFNTASAQDTLQRGTLTSGDNDPSDSYLGKIENMAVYESLNAPHTAGTYGLSGSSQDVVLAGHPIAWTMAEGINKTEAYRPPLRFADAVKGLVLYGAKTVRPYALAYGILQAV